MLRDFDLARRERATKRTPAQFRLGGETFTLLPVIPIGAAFDLHDAPEPEADEPGAVRAIARFITQALVEDDVARFDQVLRSRTEVVDPEALLEVGAHLVEVYTGRPTGPSTGSSGGRARSGARSKPRGPKATLPT